MGYHPVVQAASEGAAGIGGYQFRNLLDIQSMVHATPAMFANFASAYRVMGEQLAQTPTGAEIGAHYVNLAAHFQSMAASAQTTAAMFEAKHAADMKRLMNPRQNEQMADYSANQG